MRLFGRSSSATEDVTRNPKSFSLSRVVMREGSKEASWQFSEAGRVVIDSVVRERHSSTRSQTISGAGRHEVPCAPPTAVLKRSVWRLHASKSQVMCHKAAA